MTLPIAIIIVTHYSAPDLEACLVSIPPASVDDVHVVVVDNATLDDSVSAIVARHPEVRFIAAGANLGYGGAVNLAVRTLDSSIEWVLVTNPDARYRPGSIDSLYDTARRYRSVGSAGPRIEDEKGDAYPSARKLPSLRVGVGHAILFQFWPGNPWTARYHNADLTTSGNDSPIFGVGWLSGACLLIRRSAFEQVGGFDDKFFMYFEDVDLGHRLSSAGWRNVYVPEAVVSHSGGTSTRRYSDLMLRVHHESAYRYLAKRYHHWYLWPLRMSLKLGLAFRYHLESRTQR